MRFAVTGGAGFIGHHLVNHLLEQNHTPVVIDTLYRGKLENLPPDVEFHKIDIRDRSIESVLKNTDGIFHQAALTDVQESFSKQDEYFDVNVRGTENIFKIAKKLELKVVYASSSSVYGNPKKVPISEDSQRKPINPYGNTKLEDEFLAEKFTRDGSSIIGLRYFNVYGKGQTGSYAGVITKFINRLQEKKPPVIFGDGTQLRDFIFVNDVTQANLAAMHCNVKSGFYNVGTGVATSIKELAEIMIRLSGLNLKPIYEKPLQGDVQSSQADTTLATRVLNWRYQTTLKDGLKTLFEQTYQNNN
ncbi:MAG: NAD-dependent epimerase/dehydratase family protein [Candidatus Nitrosotenuis sp.]